jgi:hypothetical protein
MIQTVLLSKQGFTRSDFSDPICNKTSIRMHMTKQQPFLEARNFHHKLQILLEAIIGCKTSSETRRSHDYIIDVHIIVLQPPMV